MSFLKLVSFCGAVALSAGVLAGPAASGCTSDDVALAQGAFDRATENYNQRILSRLDYLKVHAAFIDVQGCHSSTFNYCDAMRPVFEEMLQIRKNAGARLGLSGEALPMLGDIMKFRTACP